MTDSLILGPVGHGLSTIFGADELAVLAREASGSRNDAAGFGSDYASGAADGAAMRRRGEQPSRALLVCSDRYSVGFRAGYFGRHGRGETW